MSETTSRRDDYDEVPAAVVFQRDPRRTRRRRRIGLTVGAVIVGGCLALGIVTPGGRLVFFIFTAPFVILIAVLAKLWWNAAPPELVIDNNGITYNAKHVAWAQVGIVMLEVNKLREGGTAPSFIVKDIQDRQVIWFFAHSTGAYVPDLVDAFELFAPLDVLDTSLQRYRNGPDGDSS